MDSPVAQHLLAFRISTCHQSTPLSGIKGLDHSIGSSEFVHPCFTADTF